jgi:hypothetical protein
VYEKIRYSNGCSPLERDSTGNKYYIDSDIQTKPAGQATVSLSVGQPSFKNDQVITDSATQICTSYSFVFLKNLGETDVLITFDNSNYLLTLSKNESFASEIATSADVRVKTSSGSSIIQWFRAR